MINMINMAHKEGDDQNLIQRGGRRQTVEVEEEEPQLSELISKSSVLIAGAAVDDNCGKFKKVPNNCAMLVPVLDFCLW